jgi:hypothetical protein
MGSGVKMHWEVVLVQCGRKEGFQNNPAMGQSRHAG